MVPNSENSNCFLLEKHRIESFKKWPYKNSSPCNLKKMAEAGFYWTGNSTEIDNATCFLCGKELDSWEENDDPWFEHRKRAPQCAFVKIGLPEAQITVADFISLMEAYAIKMRTDSAVRAEKYMREKKSAIRRHLGYKAK